MLVAIKKIENLFEYKTFTKRTLREIRILRMLVSFYLPRIHLLEVPKERYSGVSMRAPSL